MILSSIDAWLMRQSSLIHSKKRQAYPIVLQRVRVADSLTRRLQSLGLTRRARPTPSLQDYLAQKGKEEATSPPDEPSEGFTESTNTQHKKERDGEAP